MKKRERNDLVPIEKKTSYILNTMFFSYKYQDAYDTIIKINIIIRNNWQIQWITKQI